ncbi:MAG: lysophospholipid acyltransferase family protein [Terrimicrobiaceae bacterium]
MKGKETFGRPHTERWAYRWLYTDKIFTLTSAIYPLAGRKFATATCRAVALFYAATQPGVRKTVQENLRLLGGGTPADARRVFRNFATVISDYVGVGVMSPEEVRGICGGFHGRENLGSGRGVILATAHYGFFEYGGPVLSGIGMPLTIGTLPEPTSALTKWRAVWRQRWGVETVEVGADPFSSLTLQAALGAGRSVAVLVDRPQDGQSVPVDGPGGAISFSISAAVLSYLSGAPVVPVLVSLQPDGLHKVEAFPPEQARRVAHGERRKEIERCTREVASRLVSGMAKDPTQWFQFIPCQNSR